MTLMASLRRDKKGRFSNAGCKQVDKKVYVLVWNNQIDLMREMKC
jgi:hypothetical protein